MEGCKYIQWSVEQLQYTLYTATSEMRSVLTVNGVHNRVDPTSSMSKYIYKLTLTSTLNLFNIHNTSIHNVQYILITYTVIYIYVQWKPSIKDTIGTSKPVLLMELRGHLT